MIGIIYSNNNTAVTNAVSQKNGAFHGPRVHVLPADLGGQVSIRIAHSINRWKSTSFQWIFITKYCWQLWAYGMKMIKTYWNNISKDPNKSGQCNPRSSRWPFFFPPLLAELANPWLRQGISTQTRAVTCAKDVGLKKLRAWSSRWISLHSFMIFSVSCCKTTISMARACPFTCLSPLQNSAMVIRPSPSSRIVKRHWQSDMRTSKACIYCCTLVRLIADSNSSGESIPSPSSSSASKRVSSLRRNLLASCRWLSIKISASLAVLSSVSFKNRAVTIRITAKTTSGFSSQQKGTSQKNMASWKKSQEE